jgi:uncharacterized membrane protein YtjA (UPF0391 family)
MYAHPRVVVQRNPPVAAVGRLLHDEPVVADGTDSGATLVCRCVDNQPKISTPEDKMLHYAVVFFVIALVAALFGFTGLAAGAAGIAKILFFVFLAVAIVAFVMNMLRKA